jgi:hypothetical protein
VSRKKLEQVKTNPSRVFFLDNLRLFLTILVVLHHTAITYGADGSWYYYATISEGLADSFTSVLLTIVAAINASFFMGAFFLLSGYFTPGSYNRKGALIYYKDRFIRLGIPIIFFIVFIAPFINSYLSVMVFNAPISLIDYYLQSLISRTYFGIGPLWFLQALLIFALLYGVVESILKVRINNRMENQININVEKNRFPERKTIFSAILLLGACTFIVRLIIPSDTPVYNLPLGDFVQYVFLFVIGIIAYHQDWIMNITDSEGKFWSKVTLGSILFLIVFAIVTGALEGDTSAFQGGFTWQSMLGSFMSSIMCVSIFISLVSFFRRDLNSDNKYVKILTQNAFTVYIIHAPVVVITSVSVAGIVLHPLFKFICVLALALSFCFILSHFVLRRIPGAKRVLG